MDRFLLTKNIGIKDAQERPWFILHSPSPAMLISVEYFDSEFTGDSEPMEWKIIDSRTIQHNCFVYETPLSLVLKIVKVFNTDEVISSENTLQVLKRASRWYKALLMSRKAELLLPIQTKLETNRNLFNGAKDYSSHFSKVFKKYQDYYDVQYKEGELANWKFTEKAEHARNEELNKKYKPLGMLLCEVLEMVSDTIVDEEWETSFYHEPLPYYFGGDACIRGDKYSTMIEFGFDEDKGWFLSSRIQWPSILNLISDIYWEMILMTKKFGEWCYDGESFALTNKVSKKFDFTNHDMSSNVFKLIKNYILETGYNKYQVEADGMHIGSIKVFFPYDTEPLELIEKLRNAADHLFSCHKILYDKAMELGVYEPIVYGNTNSENQIDLNNKLLSKTYGSNQSSSIHNLKLTTTDKFLGIIVSSPDQDTMLNLYDVLNGVVDLLTLNKVINYDSLTFFVQAISYDARHASYGDYIKGEFQDAPRYSFAVTWVRMMSLLRILSHHKDLIRSSSPDLWLNCQELLNKALTESINVSDKLRIALEYMVNRIMSINNRVIEFNGFHQFVNSLEIWFAKQVSVDSRKRIIGHLPLCFVTENKLSQDLIKAIKKYAIENRCDVTEINYPDSDYDNWAW